MDSENIYLQDYARDLIRNSLDCISTSDKEGQLVVFNPAAVSTFGYTLEEVKTLGYEVMFANQEEFNRVHTILNEKGVYKGEVLNRRKNGEVFTSYLSANIVYDNNGEPIGTMGVSRDITSEKRQQAILQEKLNENEILFNEIQNLSEIATSVTNGIIETDATGIVLWSNKSFERMSGYQLSELLGKRLNDVFSTPPFFKNRSEEIERTKPHFNRPVQYAHFRKNGELFWVLVESTPIYNTNGSIKKIIEVCTEISEQKATEYALIKSEQNFRQISETIDDVFYLYNIVDKKYEYISPNCAKILGASPDFFYEGKSHTENYVLPEDKKITLEAEEKIERGEAYDIEFRMMINGEIRWIRERSKAIKNESGLIIRNSGICSDITEAKLNIALIQEQNMSIHESFTYARRIQNATLPSKLEIDQMFPEHLVFFQPKDSISGDFYVIDRGHNNSGNDFYAFIVADCTGHGVPGGILSILCNSLLKQSLKEYNVNSPAEALEWVKIQLNSLFHSSAEKRINDGMDVAFCAYFPDKKQLSFAGANLSCWIIRNKEFILIKGDRQHVGYMENAHEYTNHIIDLQDGDTIYLSTDGIVDQFGGASNKKFMRKQFVKLLTENAHLSMAEQKELIINSYNQWKGDSEQTDDICVFGIRI